MNNEQLNKNSINRTHTIYLLVGFIALCFRLYFNFSKELIPGVNGGYYPLQVRSILTNGFLGFSDMPFLFYFDAFLIKFISVFGFSITDSLILNVVKIVDSISLVLLLIPLYKIIRIVNHTPSKIFERSIISFAVLSFSPLILTSDLQKNATAIIFLFCFIAYLLSYQANRKKFEIILSIIFLILIGLTHFGTLIFAVFFLVLITGYAYKRKAIIPLSIVIIIGLFIVAVFDITRLNRLFSIGSLIFEKPALTNGMLAPPDYLIIIISIALAIVGIVVLKTKSSNLLSHQKGILFASIFCIITLSFPMIDGEYFKRLSLFLFIPQTLLILQIASQISDKQIKKLSVSLFIITSISILAVFGHPKETVINENAYEELKNLNSIIENDNETIIIARHGLEWWTAWILKIKVGQDKAIEGDFFKKYKNVFFITQINGFSNDKQRTPLHEPIVPQNSDMIFSSEYFKVYKFDYNKSQISTNR